MVQKSMLIEASFSIKDSALSKLHKAIKLSRPIEFSCLYTGLKNFICTAKSILIHFSFHHAANGIEFRIENKNATENKISVS